MTTYTEDVTRQGWQPRALLMAVFVFAAFFLSRILLAPYLVPEWFSIDDGLDACIKPWQFDTGRIPERGDTNYLTFTIFLWAYRLLGFSPPTARFFAITMFSLSMVVFFFGFKRAIGPANAAYVMLVLILTLPFVSRPIMPTTATSGFWITGIVFFLLAGNISRKAAIALSLLISTSAFLYFAGFLTSLSLLFFHLLFFRDRWTWPTRAALTAGFGAGTPAVWLVRRHFEHQVNIYHWGIDAPDFSYYLSTVGAILNDVFVSATSWYAFSAGYPYVGWELSTVILAGLVLVCRWNFPGISSTAKPSVSADRQKWFAIFICTFIVTLLLVSVVSRSPGVRRIFPSVLFLISSSFLLLEDLGQKGEKGVCLASFLIGCIALFAAMRTNYAVRNTWGYPPYADVEQAVSELKTHLLEAEPFEQLIVAVNNERLRQITCCSLYLGLLGKSSFPLHSQADLASLLARGNGEDAREPLPLRDDFGRVRGRTLLVTNSALNINRLQRHFEKPFKASLVLGTKAHRKSSRRLYAYEFH